MTAPRLERERTQPMLNPMHKSIDPCKENFETQGVIRYFAGIRLPILGMDPFATIPYNCAS